jgi:hypothetical protein
LKGCAVLDVLRAVEAERGRPRVEDADVVVEGDGDHEGRQGDGHAMAGGNPIPDEQEEDERGAHAGDHERKRVVDEVELALAQRQVHDVLLVVGVPQRCGEIEIIRPLV